MRAPVALAVVPVPGRMLVAAGVSLWLGMGLLLSQWRRVGRPTLVERTAPYLRSGARSGRAAPPMAVIGAGLAPFARAVGDRVTGLLGLSDDVAARLRRIHSGMDVAAFRLRQLAWALGAVAAAVAVEAWSSAPAWVGALTVPAVGLLAYLGTDADLGRRCRAFDRRRTLEMPVVAEQLAMLVAAGFSLGSALARVADRGRGACALDLARVHRRLAQGVPEREALREWAAWAASPQVERLAAVLVLSTETGDLGRLLAEEARSIRRAVQRGAVEVMDRRSQQVWVPVTVAALVPGVIFLAVPFVSALRLFAGG